MTFESIYRSLLRCWKGTPGAVPVPNQHELIAISPDTRFFSSLVLTTAPQGWTVRWARSISGAEEILAERSAPIVVYDCCSVTEDWSTSVDRLMSVSEDPCIVMAVGLVNEELWREALSRRVYDVVCRVGHGSHLAATLQFAWTWRADGRSHNKRRPGGKRDYKAFCDEAQVCR
jgi:DNA-binding NtrC family response regulator